MAERIRQSNEKKRQHEKMIIMKQRIQQKKDNLANIKSDINKLENVIKSDQKESEECTNKLEKSKQELVNQQQKIDGFADYKKAALAQKSDELQLKKAEYEFREADEQIKQAINRTGQKEGSVDKFLKLTYGLAEATMTTASHSNKLDAQISAFGELISRECQYKLTVDEYFTDKNLDRFIPILTKEVCACVYAYSCYIYVMFLFSNDRIIRIWRIWYAEMMKSTWRYWV